MLKILNEGKYFPIIRKTNFSIVTNYEGEQTLSFDIYIKDDMYNLITEETELCFRDNSYKIKKINQRPKLATIECLLNLDDWKSNFFLNFHTEYKLFSEVVNMIIPDGWTIEGAGTITGRRAITLEGVTSYDILMQCKNTYNIVFEYHILDKTIKVIKPDTFQSRGLYITDELNLKELNYKGDSTDFITRLYAFGKKTEITNDDGEVVNTDYVNFASINNGKNYVENFDYSKKILVGYWQDDRYLDPQELLDDAIDKLKILSAPIRSYSCNIVDLSRTVESYKCLDFKMYDKVTLMDSVSKICVLHQIVEYTEYPEEQHKNIVVLSTEFKKITGTIDDIKQSVSDIDTEIKRSETFINEIIRDVESNTMRINNTYTRGETDIKFESLIQQSKDDINFSLQEVIKKENEKVEEKLESMVLNLDGLTNTLSTTSGNNLIRDSIGCFNDGSWQGNYSLDATAETRSRNQYGYALLLKNNSLKQQVNVANGVYTLSFVYKKLVNLANVKLLINGDEFVLSNNDYTEFKHTFEISDGYITIVFECDTDNACPIINLMLNKGDEKMEWSLNSNETWSDTVKIGRGVRISSIGTDVEFVALADIIGFMNKQGEYITTFDSDGIVTNTAVIKNKATIVNLLIQNINDQTIINRINPNEVEVYENGE